MAEPAQSLRLQTAVDPDEPQRGGPHRGLQAGHQTGRITEGVFILGTIDLYRAEVHMNWRPPFSSGQEYITQCSYLSRKTRLCGQVYSNRSQGP